RHTSFARDWSSDVCSSDLPPCLCADLAFFSQVAGRSQRIRLWRGVGSDRPVQPGRSAVLKKGRYELGTNRVQLAKQNIEAFNKEIGRASCRERGAIWVGEE